MSSALELKVLFTAVDRFVRPVKAITGAAGEAAKALKASRDRADELNGTIAKIDAYKKLQADAAIAQNSLKKTNEQIKSLQDELKKGGEATKKQAEDLARLKDKAAATSEKIERLRGHEIDLRTALQLAKVDTQKLAEARQHLASASAAATMDSQRLQAALEAENQKMRRLKAAQADLTNSKEKAAKLAATGAGITAAGAAVGLPVGKSVKDFADFETAMLGVARQMDGARDDSGKLTRSYYDMGREIKAMSEKLPMAANDIAAIVEGGARMGIQGKENLLIYARTTAVMADAFKLPVDQIGEDIGKLSQLYKVPIKDIGALGDAINYLDDNALAKGGDIIDVMKRIAGTADMAKMNFKEAAALGSTFLSLGAKAEVAGSASNAMIRELAVAKMQGKRFQGGMAMLGLNSADVQRGMNTDATATIINVLEKIKSLNGDAQLEAATRLFGKEYGDDAAKLAANLDEYRRQLKLVNDEKARGSMQRESDARGQTLQARMDIAKNAFTNLSSDLGEHLKPAIVATLEKTLSIIQAVRARADENPRLAGGLITVVKWLAGALGVLGLLTMAAGAIIVPLAMMKFSLVTLGLTGTSALGLLGGAFSAVAGVIATVGRALLLNPIGLALTAIAIAATLIYSNWDKIGPWLAGMIDRIAATLSGLKNAALNAGSEMINGIITGIGNRWDALRASVVGVADSTIGWFKEKLGIRSPSRVFTELGMHTMAGLSKGLEDNEDGPLKALSGAAKKLTAIGAGLIIGHGVAAAELPVPAAAERPIIDAHRPADLPAPLATVRDISERLHSVELPVPAAAERSILDAHRPTDLPAPMAAIRHIAERLHPAELPVPAAAERSILDAHRPTDLPAPLAAIRHIAERLHPAELPVPATAERSILDAHRPADLPAPMAAVRHIAERLHPAELPVPAAAERSILDAHRPADLPAPMAAVRDILDRVASAIPQTPLNASRLISDRHKAISLPAPPAAVRQINDQYQPIAQPEPLKGGRQGSAGQGADSLNAGGNTYHITINAPAGSDNQALAELVAREIDRIEAGKSARQRSRLRDME